MVLDPQGRVSGTLSVHDAIAKKRAGRRIPMHLDLRRALESLARTTEPIGPVIRSYRNSYLDPKSIVNWFVALFKELGFEGCSSHSGRRSFITIGAQHPSFRLQPARDVQLLAGLRSIETTERYIDGGTLAQWRLIGLTANYAFFCARWNLSCDIHPPLSSIITRVKFQLAMRSVHAGTVRLPA